MKQLLIENGRQLVLDIIEPLPAEDGGGSADGRVLARIPLTRSHLRLARDETWWRGVRAGKLQPHLESHQMRVLFGEDRGAGRLDGYTVELTDGARSYRQHFTIYSLAPVAQRRVAELVQAKAAQLGDSYNYYLTTVPAERAGRAADPPLTARSSRQPLAFEPARLADYLAASETLQGVSVAPDSPQDPPMPIFVSQEVWDESRDMVARGGQQESAALYSGRLLRDTDSPEVFVRFDACLEAEHADQQQFSVTFTGETWARARELLALRRQRLQRPHEILVASVHRHPWLPGTDGDGRRTCQDCDALPYCNRTTAIPSAADFQWHRSVFAGQPWGTLLIWGYNAREEADFRLYGLDDATFQQRSLRLLKTEP